MPQRRRNIDVDQDKTATNKTATDQKAGVSSPHPLTKKGTPLSVRERQVVVLVSKGHQNKEIAYELGITEGTVKQHLFEIFKKVGCHNRAALTAWFMRQELVHPASTALSPSKTV